MRRRRLAVELTTITGVVAIAVGVWLPWIAVNPEYGARFPRFYVSGMGYRIEVFDWLILGFVALGVGNATELAGRRDRAAAAGRAVAGLGVALLTLLWVSDWGGIGCLFVPAVELTFGTACRYSHGPGVFTTALGGALLMSAGGYQYVAATNA